MKQSNEKKVLLIVEDNPLLVGMYKTAFEKEGVKVKIAHNGADGVAIAKDKGVSVALVDLLMHGMDGFDVIQEIKKDPTTEQIQVIVLTSISNAESKKKALKCGASDYFVKTDLELDEIVKKVLKFF